jgi:hypothetical protein
VGIEHLQSLQKFEGRIGGTIVDIHNFPTLGCGLQGVGYSLMKLNDAILFVIDGNNY